jgi:hypothetical protein
MCDGRRTAPRGLQRARQRAGAGPGERRKPGRRRAPRGRSPRRPARMPGRSCVQEPGTRPGTHTGPGGNAPSRRTASRRIDRPQGASGGPSPMRWTGGGRGRHGPVGGLDARLGGGQSPAESAPVGQWNQPRCHGGRPAVARPRDGEPGAAWMRGSAEGNHLQRALPSASGNSHATAGPAVAAATQGARRWPVPEAEDGLLEGRRFAVFHRGARRWPRPRGGGWGVAGAAAALRAAWMGGSPEGTRLLRALASASGNSHATAQGARRWPVPDAGDGGGGRGRHGPAGGLDARLGGGHSPPESAPVSLWHQPHCHGGRQRQPPVRIPPCLAGPGSGGAARPPSHGIRKPTHGRGLAQRPARAA